MASSGEIVKPSLAISLNELLKNFSPKKMEK
jgi:hypothetical protein